MTDPQRSFEADLKELEDILRKLEGSSLGLEDSMKLYERGTAILRKCYTSLDDMEGRIVRLVRREDGSIAEEPVDPAEASI
jgi:exodeoxyribonuclease VII small subunit